MKIYIRNKEGIGTGYMIYGLVMSIDENLVIDFNVSNKIELNVKA